MKKINMIFYFSILLLISPAMPSAFTADETAIRASNTVSVEPLTGQYPAEFLLTYRLEGNENLVDIDLTGIDFAKVSIILSLEPSKAGEVRVRVKSFEVSNFVVPSLLMKTVSGNSTNLSMTPEVPIEQKIQTIAATNIAPMEDIYPIGDPTALIIVLIALLVLAGGGFLAWKFLFMKKSAGVFTGSRIDPYEEALKELNRLKHLGNDAKRLKEIHLGVWETVRRFLERVFSFRAMEMSTSEIVSHFNRSDGDASLDEIHDIAIHLLKACDRVKYAKFQTSAEQTEVILNDSFELVRRTRKHFDRLKAAEEETKAGENNA